MPFVSPDTDRPTATHPDIARRAFSGLVALLLMGILINLVTAAIVRDGPSGFRSFEDDRLSTLINEEQRVIEVRYGFVGALHDVAAGGVVRAPDDIAVDVTLLETVSHVDVEVVGYEFELPQSAVAAFTPHVVAAGDGIVSYLGFRQPWYLVMSDASPATHMTYYVIDGAVYVVDDRLGLP